MLLELMVIDPSPPNGGPLVTGGPCIIESSLRHDLNENKNMQMIPTCFYGWWNIYLRS